MLMDHQVEGEHQLASLPEPESQRSQKSTSAQPAGLYSGSPLPDKLLQLLDGMQHRVYELCRSRDGQVATHEELAHVLRVHPNSVKSTMNFLRAMKLVQTTVIKGKSATKGGNEGMRITILRLPSKLPAEGLQWLLDRCESQIENHRRHITKLEAAKQYLQVLHTEGFVTETLHQQTGAVDDSTIRSGCIVTLAIDEEAPETFILDPSGRHNMATPTRPISINSHMAQLLLGHKVGDAIQAELDGATRTIHILNLAIPPVQITLVDS